MTARQIKNLESLMAIDEILNRVFRYGLEVGKLNKNYQTLNESIDAKAEKQAILALLAQEVKDARIDELEQAVQQYVFNTDRNPDNFTEYTSNRRKHLERLG